MALSRWAQLQGRQYVVAEGGAAGECLGCDVPGVAFSQCLSCGAPVEPADHSYHYLPVCMGSE